MKSKMIERLGNNEIIKGYKEGGNSMTPIIKHRQPVDIAPVNVDLLEKGDVVFCKVGKRFFTHKITAINKEKKLIQIGNNHGHINGWTSYDKIYGIIIAINDVVVSSALKKVKEQV